MSGIRLKLLARQAAKWVVACALLTMCHSDRHGGPPAPPFAAEPLEPADIVAAATPRAPSPAPTEPPARTTAAAETDNSSPGDELGKIVGLQGRVTFRRAKQLVWEEGLEGVPLYAFDAIRTDTGASAKIVLVNGSTIELQENSLVILNPSAVGRSVRRDKATVRAGRLKTETRSELWILTSAALLKLKPKSPQASAKASLAVKEGAQVKVELQAGRASLLAKDPADPKAPPKIVKLAVRSPIAIAAPSARESFGWDNSDPLWEQAERQGENSEEAKTPPEPPRAPVLARRQLDRRRVASGADIVITEPANYSELDANEVRIAGRVTGRDGEVRINGQLVPINAKMEFSEVVPLHPGANSIVIQFSREGGTVFRRWTVIRR